MKKVCTFIGAALAGKLDAEKRVIVLEAGECTGVTAFIETFVKPLLKWDDVTLSMMRTACPSLYARIVGKGMIVVDNTTIQVDGDLSDVHVDNLMGHNAVECRQIYGKSFSTIINTPFIVTTRNRDVFKGSRMSKHCVHVETAGRRFELYQRGERVAPGTQPAIPMTDLKRFYATNGAVDAFRAFCCAMFETHGLVAESDDYDTFEVADSCNLFV